MEDEEVIASVEQTEGDEEDDGTVTEAENALLNTPPASVAETTDPDHTESMGPESQTASVEDRQA